MAHLPESRKKPYGVEYVFRSLIANFATAMQVWRTRTDRAEKQEVPYRPSPATEPHRQPMDSVTKALDAMASSGLILRRLGQASSTSLATITAT